MFRIMSCNFSRRLRPTGNRTAISSYFSSQSRRSSNDTCVLVMLGFAVLPLSFANARLKAEGSDKPQVQLSINASRGDRKYMEDRFFVSKDKRYIGVFDGHGGAHVAEYLKNRLYPLVNSYIEEAGALKTKAEALLHYEIAPFEKALRKAFKTLDDEVIQRHEWQHEGSTAAVVMLLDNYILTANVGDSRALLCRCDEAIDLSTDHKPNHPSERLRIEKLGGTVAWYGYVDLLGNPIPDTGAYRVNGNLAVARSIGDRDLRPFISAEPEIRYFQRDESDQFIIVASDGLWDVISSDEAVEFVLHVLAGGVGGRGSWRSGSDNSARIPLSKWKQQYGDDTDMIKAATTCRKNKMSEYLVQEAVKRGSMDNITAVVVWLS